MSFPAAPPMSPVTAPTAAPFAIQLPMLSLLLQSRAPDTAPDTAPATTAQPIAPTPSERLVQPAQTAIPTPTVTTVLQMSLLLQKFHASPTALVVASQAFF